MKVFYGLCLALFAAVARGGSDAVDALPAGVGSPGADVCAVRVATATAAVPTAIAMRVPVKPIPVLGSDARLHIVYEIEMVNATGATLTLQQLTVHDAADGRLVFTMPAAELAKRLVVRDRSAVRGTLGASQAGIAYVHVSFENAAAMPAAIDHRLSVSQGAGSTVEAGACSTLAATTDLVIDAPLRGPRYIAGDGCCDAARHTRASLAVNGSFFTAQRFAIDWEQIDEQGRIYAGDVKDPASYFIYGKPAYAVADGTVVSALDGLPDSPIGSLPPDLPLAQADGNHVVLDIGGSRFALYAHFKPNSVLVKKGERVRRGQVLGLVGTSGNSSEPHLHFHVTDGPSPLASSGVPYKLQGYTSTTRGVSTAAFDKAIIDGLPIAAETVPGPARHERVLPLDLSIVELP